MDEFLVPTGAIIKDYLEARGISQRELSQRIGVSEKHISNLLNGKSALTAPMALKLEKLMPDVDACLLYTSPRCRRNPGIQEALIRCSLLTVHSMGANAFAL